MFTGRPPFVGGTMLQKLLQHQADQPPEVRQFRPDLPEEVDRILRRMMAKDPARRYATPAELVDDLLSVARAAGLRPAAPGGRHWTVPVKPAVPYYYRHLPWLVSVAALFAIVFLLDRLWPYLPGPAAAPSVSSTRDSGNAPAAIEKGTGGAGTMREGKDGERGSGDRGLPASSARTPSGEQGIPAPSGSRAKTEGRSTASEAPSPQLPSSSAAPPLPAADLRPDWPQSSAQQPLSSTDAAKSSASPPPVDPRH